MREHISSTQVTAEELADDLKVVVTDAEELLRATASQAGEKATEARSKIQESLDTAKVKLARLGEVSLHKAKQAAHATDELVHEQPWKAIGVGTAVGIVLGMLIARR
jgi:ElaB/YqjD/DUF883 family membrane-anchored ribosome-binding protein